MRLRFIWVGKTKNDHLRALAEDYLGRIRRFTQVQIQELRESELKDYQLSRQDETRRLENARTSDSPLILLDVTGQQWTSSEVAQRLDNWQVYGPGDVAFVLGGHLGVAPELKMNANVCWSLSRLTLTHEMARVLMLEQIYRGFTIVRGLPYQK